MYDGIEKRKHTQVLPECEERSKNIFNALSRIENKICSHIREGETPKTGFRDRLIVLEQTVDTLKKSYWKTALVAGLVGGLLGKLTPEVFNFLIRIALAGVK
jgi:hypothetical protein